MGSKMRDQSTLNYFCKIIFKQEKYSRAWSRKTVEQPIHHTGCRGGVQYTKPLIINKNKSTISVSTDDRGMGLGLALRKI